MRCFLNLIILITFCFSNFYSYPVFASVDSVAPNLLKLTPSFEPIALKGLRLYPDNPFKFDFLLDEGNTAYTDSKVKEESVRLINYFLTALTIPDKELWVNLSPYEQQRVIPNELSTTQMGADMLSQDYILKQLASSLTYPDTPSGKQYWDTLQGAANGLRSAAVNNFQKVWIVPDKSVIYTDGDKAYVGEATLKVLCEADYLALQNNQAKPSDKDSQAFKADIVPLLTKEVNEGSNFIQLRQMYKSLVLAAWFKKHLKENVINRLYSDKKKTSGVDTAPADIREKVYSAYIQSCRQGVYNIIKSERTLNKITKRSYFSGGLALGTVDPVVKSLILAPGKVLSDTTQVTAVLQQLAQSTNEEGNHHGLYVNENGNRWMIYVNSDQIQKYIDDFKTIFGENVTVEQARLFIAGHEAFHALVDYLRDTGHLLADIDTVKEDFMANQLGYAYAMHRIQAYGGMKDVLVEIGKILGVDLVDLLDRDSDNIKQLLARMGIFVTVEVKTPPEIARLKAEALAKGYTVKSNILGGKAKGITTFALAVALGLNMLYCAKDTHSLKTKIIDDSGIKIDAVKPDPVPAPSVEPLKNNPRVIEPDVINPYSCVITKRLIDKKAGLNWKIVSEKLIGNELAERISPTQVRITENIYVHEHHLSVIFGDDFSKLWPILQQANQVSPAFMQSLEDGVKGLEIYYDKTAKDFARMAFSWKGATGSQLLVTWKDELDFARQQYSRDKERLAGVEAKIIGELVARIDEELTGGNVFALPIVIKYKVANCMGFMQMHYLLGEFLGLSPQGVNATKAWDNSHMSSGNGHIETLFTLSNGMVVMTNVREEHSVVSAPFDFNKTFIRKGNYWVLRDKNNPGKLYRTIRVLDKNGVVAALDNEAGIFYINGHDYPIAIAALERAIELDPDNLDAYTNLGSVYDKQHKYRKAIEFFSRSIELHSDADSPNTEASVYSNLGIVYAEQKDYLQAIAMFRRAIDIDPGCADAYNNLGVIYLRQKKYGEAIEVLKRAIDINSDFADVYINLGDVYDIRRWPGDREQAQKYFAIAKKLKQQSAGKPLFLNNKYQGLFYRSGTTTKPRLATNRSLLEAHKEDFREVLPQGTITVERMQRFTDGHETLHALVDMLSAYDPEVATIYNYTEEEPLANVWGVAFADGHVTIPPQLKRAVAILERALNKKLSVEGKSQINLAKYIQNLDPYDSANPKALEQVLKGIGIDVEVVDATPEQLAELKKGIDIQIAQDGLGYVEHDVGGIAYDPPGNITRRRILGGGLALLGAGTVARLLQPTLAFADRLSSADKSTGVSVKIQQAIKKGVKDLEIYDDQTADDFLAMVWSFKDANGRPVLLSWQEELDNTRKTYHGDKAKLAHTEEKIIRALALRLHQEFKGTNANSGSNLSRVIRDRSINCVGEIQVFSILGNCLGLFSRGVEVKQSCDGKLALEDLGHVEAIFNLSNGKVIMTNIYDGEGKVSAPFNFTTTFIRDGNYWNLRTDSRLPLHKRIRCSDSNSILWAVCSNHGAAYARAGDLDTAIRYYTKAIEVDPRFALAYHNRGAAYATAGDLDKANLDFTKAIEINHEYAAAYLKRGGVYARAGNHAQAIRDFTKVIEIDPKAVLAYENRASSYIKTGNMDKAIRDYYKIIEIAPKYAEVYYNLGTTYSEIGDLDRALSNLNKAIELNPGNSAAYHNRAVVYSKKGDTVSAMQDLAMEAKVMQQRRRVPASPKYLNGLYQGLFKAYVDGVLEIYTNRTWLLAHLDDFKAKFGEDVTLDQARRAIDGHETFHALMHVLRLQSQELLASIDNDTEEELADLLEIAFVKNTVKIPERLIPAVKIIERALNIRLQSEDNPIDLIEYIQNFDPYDAADPKALERLLDSIGIRVTVIDKTPAEIAEIKAKAESPQARAVGVKVEKDVGGIDYQQGLNIQEKGRGIKINDMPSNLNFDPAGLKGFKVEIIGLERRNREV